MYLLDTNHCSRLIMKLIMKDVALLRRIIEVETEQISTCTIVQGELVHMAENSQQRAGNLALVRQFLQSIYIYPIDESTADIYGEFKAEIIHYFGPKEKAKRRGVRISNLGISENDLWIAAVALQHKLILVSGDSDFQRMREVRPFPLESWR